MGSSHSSPDYEYMERREREWREREERERSEREERERKEREEREKERQRERKEAEAREERLWSEMAAKEAELKRRAENEAAMREEHEKKQADLMKEFDAKAAAIKTDVAEKLAAMDSEKEAMKAKLEKEKEEEEKKAMLAQENLQKLKGDHDLLQAEKDNIEENWKKGIRPTERVTKEEFLAVKERYEYQTGMFHIAIAGIAGSGKSSLLNAFLGVTNKDPRAARTDVVECTDKVARYPGEPPAVYYDIPGAGTLDKPGWRYFNEQGLYIFDCIIVLFDTRFTETDASILQNCQIVEPPIPTFIVRSKSDQHIKNLYDSKIEDEDDLDEAEKAEIRQECIANFVEKTKTSVQKNLKQIGHGVDENQRVYLVSKVNIKAIVKRLRDGDFFNNLVKNVEVGENLGENVEFVKNLARSGEAKTSAAVLDEYDLIHDILAAGCACRIQQP